MKLNQIIIQITIKTIAMSNVMIVIGCFTLAFIFLMGLAIFFVKPDHNTESEEQFGQDEKPVESKEIHWGDVRP